MENQAYRRPSWDEYFMKIAELVGSRGTCDRGRAGCVIVKEKRVVCTGYVGSPMGLPHCDEVGHEIHTVTQLDGSQSKHCIRTTHAEQNAICQAAKFGVSISGGTIYCKMTPCYACAKMIINAGITRVVCAQDYHAGGRSKEIFAKANVAFELLSSQMTTYPDMGNLTTSKIIAILGLPGSGKTEVINYLLNKYQLPRVYFPEAVFNEIKKRGWAINEKNERLVREELPKQLGPLYLAEAAITKIDQLPNTTNILVESMYSWEEYLRFKEKFGQRFTTVAVYASPQIRYSRLSQRPIRPLTPTEAKSRDHTQITNRSQAGPLAIADYTIINEDLLANLHQQAELIYQKIINS